MARGTPRRDTPRAPASAGPSRASVDSASVDADWRVWLLLAAITFVVFLPVWRGGFLSWDDQVNLYRNPRLNPPSIDAVASFWAAPYLELYIPVTYTAWSGLAALAYRSEPDAAGISLTPWVFHAANLLVHILNCAVVFEILRRLISADQRRDQPLMAVRTLRAAEPSAWSAAWPAAAGAILFAVHPLQVEAVAWATGMKDLLCGFFSLLAVWQYVCMVDPRETATGGAKWLRGSVIVIALSLAVLCKPSALTAPLATLVIDRWILHRAWKKVLAASAPQLFLMIIGLAWMASTSHQGASPADGGRAWVRPLIAADSLAFYLAKILVPWKLGFHYDRAPSTIIESGAIYFTWLAPAVVLALTILSRRKLPYLLPAIGLFVAAVLTVLGLTPFAFQRFSDVADRYVYFAMLGPAYAMAAELHRVAPFHSASRAQAVWRWQTVAALMILALFAIRSERQAGVYRNDSSFYSSGLAVNPRSFAALDGLALDLIHKQKFEEAELDAHRALEIHDSDAGGYVVAARVLAAEGRVVDAETLLRQLVEKCPTSGEALGVLGGLLCKRGDYAGAEPYLRAALKLDAQDAVAHAWLAAVCHNTGRASEFADQTRLAITLDPGNAVAQAYDAVLLDGEGRHDEAAIHRQIAAKIDPDVLRDAR